jgi:hypothetical protein
MVFSVAAACPRKASMKAADLTMRNFMFDLLIRENWMDGELRFMTCYWKTNDEFVFVSSRLFVA